MRKEFHHLLSVHEFHTRRGPWSSCVAESTAKQFSSISQLLRRRPLRATVVHSAKPHAQQPEN